MSRSPASRVVMALIVAALLLADLGPSLWHAPSAAAQSAAPYHWARKRPHFRLRVGNNVAGDWNRYLRGALDEWNQNETVTLIEVDGATDPQYCEPVAGTVQVCDWWYGTQTEWLGLTRLFFNASGDHIDAATVLLNNSFLYAPNSPYNTDAARRHTLCHELGHALGIDHIETTSCVNDSQYAVFNYVTPANGDFRQLRRIYEHTDATRTVARAQDADLNLFDAPSWPEPDSETDQGLAGAQGLDPSNADTDGDGVAVADELNLYRTNPTLADTDGDSVLDGDELFGRHTDPLLWDDVGTDTGAGVAPSTVTVSGDPGALATAGASDTDRDADNYPDALEVEVGLDPRNPDTDGDGVADGDEVNLYGTDPFTWDTDGDGRSDGEELFAAGTDPLTWNTPGDGIADEEIDLP